MIRHVAMFTWKPETTAEQKELVSAELAKLPPLLNGLRAYSFSADVGLNEGNADFVVVADFDDVDAYLGYRDHPEHVRVATQVIGPIVAQRMAIQVDI
jgi:hypothetical protein